MSKEEQNTKDEGTPPEKAPEASGEGGSSAHGKGLLLGIVAAIVLGVMLGGWAPKLAVHTAVLGEIFLRSLMMIVVPLVMLSMIVGITGLGDIRRLGSIGWRTVAFYMVTTALSVLVGLILVNVIQPGKGLSPGEKHLKASYTIDSKDHRTVTLGKKWERSRFQEYKGKYAVFLKDQKVWGVVSGITEKTVTVRFWERLDNKGVTYIKGSDGTRFPFRRVKGRLVSAEPQVKLSGTGVSIGLAIADKIRGKEGKGFGSVLHQVFVEMIPRNIFKAMAQTDVLSLIFFALLLGAVLSVLGESARPTLEVISTLNDAIMRLVGWIMFTAPVGIFGLVAARIGKAGGFSGFLPELVALGKYASTIVFGLGFHGLVTLPVILWIFGRRSPLQYARGMGAALLNAFSTASSSATLPLTMEGVEKENGISNRTASFVLPLGATINMDGTALYEAVAAMFIAQVYGIELTMIQQIIIFLTSTLAAIGAAGIPEAGLVTMVIVLKAVGLPIEGIGLILTIDWLLDRFRTTVNVWGDSVGAGVIETLEQNNKETPAAEAAS